MVRSVLCRGWPSACEATSCGATFHRKCGRIEKLRSTIRMASAVGDHHGDRESVVDLAVHEPRLDAEGVVGKRGPEERADLLVIAGLRVRATEQRLHLVFQAMPGQAW